MKKTKSALIAASTLLAWSGLFGVRTAQAQSQTVTNVVAIGDSITEDTCCGGSGAWRVPLKASLASTNTPINLVGRMTDASGSYTAKGGASTCDFFSSGRPDFYAALGNMRDQGSATVAIANIGTNDYINRLYLGLGYITPYAPYSCPSSLASFGRFYDALVHNPSLTGVVITTIESADGDSLTDYENAIIAGYVADRQAEGRNVCLATLPSFVGLTNPGDAYHLSAYGKQVVAATLVAPTQRAIRGQCASPIVPPTTTSTSTTTSTTSTTIPSTAERPLLPRIVPSGAFTSAQADLNPAAFRPIVAGVTLLLTSTTTATAVEFYKVNSDRSTSRQVGIWDGSGTLVASGTTSGEPSAGWTRGTLSAPILLAPGVYTFGVHNPSGAYGYQYDFHATAQNGTGYSIPANGGTYAYSSTLVRPTATYRASYYAVVPIVR